MWNKHVQNILLLSWDPYKDFTFLYLSFLTCKMEMIIISHGVVIRIK